MSAKLTSEMRRAIAFAREHGGHIHRHAGGFWSSERASSTTNSFGTSTIEALASRGVAEYTEWKDGRSGRFPTRITLIKQGTAE